MFDCLKSPRLSVWASFVSGSTGPVRCPSVADYDGEVLRTRRRGRPAMGSGPADVAPVRIDPVLKAVIEARVKADDTTTSEIIRAPQVPRGRLSGSRQGVALPIICQWFAHGFWRPGAVEAGGVGG